jgi:phage terminase Nu1 subunit (DNA packaging protein)
MIQDYQPQPDPLAQQKAQLEIELLKAQIENERAKGQENATDVYLKQWKAENEKAKARALNSKADITDLDYIEQATGLKQDRELEKQMRNNESKERIVDSNNIAKLLQARSSSNTN